MASVAGVQSYEKDDNLAWVNLLWNKERVGVKVSSGQFFTDKKPVFENMHH